MDTNSVNVITNASGYVVRLFENGAVFEKQFTAREFATAWAAGQRMRLGLPLEERFDESKS